MAGLVLKCVGLFFLASVFVEVASAQTCAMTDSYSLQYFIQEIVYARKEFVTWIAGTNCCKWDGVTCNGNGNVEFLNVANADIVAKKPQGDDYYIGSGLTSLTALTNLTLINIPFNGMIPDAWGAGLPHLQVLNIDGCNVVGNISESLCLLTELQTLILKDNLLDGPVPSCIANAKKTFPKLRTFNISGNPNLKGSIPAPFKIA